MYEEASFKYGGRPQCRASWDLQLCPFWPRARWTNSQDARSAAPLQETETSSQRCSPPVLSHQPTSAFLRKQGELGFPWRGWSAEPGCWRSEPKARFPEKDKLGWKATLAPSLLHPRFVCQHCWCDNVTRLLGSLVTKPTCWLRWQMMEPERPKPNPGSCTWQVHGLGHLLADLKSSRSSHCLFASCQAFSSHSRGSGSFLSPHSVPQGPHPFCQQHMSIENILHSRRRQWANRHAAYPPGSVVFGQVVPCLVGKRPSFTPQFNHHLPKKDFHGCPLGETPSSPRLVIRPFRELIHISTQSRHQLQETFQVSENGVVCGVGGCHRYCWNRRSLAWMNSVFPKYTVYSQAGNLCLPFSIN